MPYINQIRRQDADLVIDCIAQSSGELNYLFTCVLQKYLDEHKISYRTINDVIGALEGAKLEFYRRVAIPYEQEKIKENGDVYDN